MRVTGTIADSGRSSVAIVNNVVFTSHIASTSMPAMLRLQTGVVTRW